MTASRADRMNVVCVVIDTLRHDVVHHGEPFPHVAVPNLDALRAESVEFTAAFGEGEPTIPVRRALWTGMRSFPWRFQLDTVGVWPTPRGWHKIPPEQPTLAEILLERGYRTSLVSDVYHMFKPTMNFSRGWLTWDFIRGQETDNWRSGRLSLVYDEARRYVKGDVDPARHAVLLQYLFNKRAFGREDPLTSGTVFRRAGDWLAENHDSGPFLLWLEAFDPHEPWDPPREYADRYCPGFEGTEFILPPDAATQGTEREQDRTRALYFGEVTYVDECLGRLVNQLAELGRLDDTAIVVISDHGTELMDHGRFGKSAPALYAHNTQLNWSIRHPDLAGGSSVDAFVGNHDIFPTILDMLGVPEPDRPETDRPYAGRSVWPLVRHAGGDRVDTGELDRAGQGREFAITGWADYAAVRSRDWNAIVNFEQPDDDARLFDLGADPLEQRNVLSEHPDVAADHTAVLEAFLGQRLPAKLPDHFESSRPPCRVYYGSEATRLAQESGFM